MPQQPVALLNNNDNVSRLLPTEIFTMRSAEAVMTSAFIALSICTVHTLHTGRATVSIAAAYRYIRVARPHLSLAFLSRVASVTHALRLDNTFYTPAMVTTIFSRHFAFLDVCNTFNG